MAATILGFTWDVWPELGPVPHRTTVSPEPRLQHERQEGSVLERRQERGKLGSG